MKMNRTARSDRRSGAARARRGFSLLEVAVGTSLLTMGISSLLSVIVGYAETLIEDPLDEGAKANA